MANDQDFVDFVVDQIENGCEVSYRHMFGGTSLYLNGKVVALICDNQLFVKPTEAGRVYIGMVVEAPEMASSMAVSGLESFQSSAYRLQLNQRGRLTWHQVGDGKGRVLTTEPETGFWRRFRTRLMGLLPIERQM